MTPELTHEILKRLPLEDLDKAGRQALAAQDYSRAHALLREAVRRAPFRQDFRDLLSVAMEGKLSEPGSVDGSQSTLEAFRVRQHPQPAPRPATEPVDELPHGRITPAMARGATRTIGHRGTTARPRPGEFQRRHERGPVSAMLFGGFVAISLIAMAGMTFWIYTHREPAMSFRGRNGGTENIAQNRLAAALEQSRVYMQQRNYSLAIDQLTSLEQSSARDERLAEIYTEIGNEAFKQEPPRLESALEAYSNAVKYNDKNPAYGSALADAYYSLSGQHHDDPSVSKHLLDLAKQTLEAVIDRDPNYLPAYKQMSRVALAQRDYTLMQQSLQKILDLAPKESEEARNARDSLQSLGLKYRE